MQLHRNAKLGLSGRFALVKTIEGGCSLREAARRPRRTSYPGAVRRVLVTGMSGVGKSTALAELARDGFDVVETDVPPWSKWSEAAGGYVWREKLVSELLAGERRTTLYVSGAVSNQGRFYSQFDAVVLLSAPQDVLLRRIESRTTNEYRKRAEQRERIIRDMVEVEPLLRATSTHEIVTTKPIADVVAELVAIGRSKPPEES